MLNEIAFAASVSALSLAGPTDATDGILADKPDAITEEHSGILATVDGIDPANEMDLDLKALPCPPDPALGPTVAAERFLYAFTRLDQACFNEMWTEDATAFLPLLIGDAGPGRLNGRDEILATFDKFFAGRPNSEEDVLDIQPDSLRIDQVGEVAVVSFVLGPSLDNRRTFVFRRENDGWRIWHHHASWLGDFEAILEAEVQRRLSESSGKN